MISTTITKNFYNMKMQDLKEHGFFYEYKEAKPFWDKRINKLFPISDDGAIKPLDDIEIVFLVGNKPHRFKVASFSYHLHIHDKDSTVPERYRSAIKTDYAYGIKCVEQIARRVA